MPVTVGVAERADHEAAAAAAAALEEQLVVGEKAPGWMVAMLAAVTARVTASGAA